MDKNLANFYKIKWFKRINRQSIKLSQSEKKRKIAVVWRKKSQRKLKIETFPFIALAENDAKG